MKSLLLRDELIQAVNGTALNSADCFFTSVATDSREVKENTLFVPLVGTVQNGHKYIPSAITLGATVILVNKKEVSENEELYKEYVKNNQNVLFIAVENTLYGLQNAAESYVAKFDNLLKIAITGSCGKTTTKEMMVSVAKAHFGDEATVYTKGNFNSETGLPLSVFQIRENHKCGIFEMGMNREDEIGEISKVLKARFAIITNIGTAHIGILGSRENIAKEKRKAFSYIPSDGAAFVPADDDFADYCLENVKGKNVKFGKSIAEEISGVKYLKDNGIFGTEFTVDGLDVKLPISGDYNFINALGVIACARQIGISAEEIRNGLENMSSVSGRMEIKKESLVSGKEVVLVKDFYNANPDSMKKGIEFVAGLKDYSHKIYVLADMKELGEKSESAHAEIGDLLASLTEEKSESASVYFIGEDILPAFNVLTSRKADSKNSIKIYWVKDNSEENFNDVAAKIVKETDEKSVIMFKGSHSMNLEKLCNKLLEAE